MAELPYLDESTPSVPPIPFSPSININDFEVRAEKGTANGYAPLDASAKVPLANLPDQASLDAEVQAAISAHNALTTAHGIANTANLVYTNDARLSDSRTPIAHNHAISEITNLQNALDGKQASGSYVLTSDSRLSDTRDPNSHSHAISDVTNLQTTLDGKQPSGSYAPATGISPSAITGTAVVTNDARLSDARTPLSHNHDDRYYTETEIDAGLTQIGTALSGKAASIHSHAISDVTNLQTVLDGKQASGSYELTSNRNAANGYAGLGADGKIALSQLPDANALESEAIAFAIALG